MWRNTMGLIVMLTLGILVVPLAADAQQPKHVPRIGFLSCAQSPMRGMRHSSKGCTISDGLRVRISRWSIGGQQAGWTASRRWQKT